jgi:monomeric sarcosine oxidase
MNRNTADFVVIGAGVFGVWIAYELRRRGHSVILVDAHGAGNSRSSSGDESRIIRMGYGADALYTQWAIRSLAHWKEIFAQSGQDLFVNTGVLWLASENDSYTRSIPTVLSQHGVLHEQLTPAEIGVRFPQLSLQGVAFAICEPHSGVLLARRAVQAVLERCIQSRVEYRIGLAVPPSPAARISHVDVNGEAIHASNFVFACGAWLPSVFPNLLGTRIFPTRQEVFYFGTPAGSSQFKPPAMPVWLHHAEDMYGLPDVDNRGIKVACDRHGEAFDPETGERVVSSKNFRSVAEYVGRRLPQIGAAHVAETRVCQYENTSNGDFLIDRHPEMDNVWIAGGGSGHGFKHGPTVGEYTAARILGDANAEQRFSLATKLEVQRRAVY